MTTTTTEDKKTPTWYSSLPTNYLTPEGLSEAPMQWTGEGMVPGGYKYKGMDVEYVPGDSEGGKSFWRQKHAGYEGENDVLIPELDMWSRGNDTLSNDKWVRRSEEHTSELQSH